MPRKSKNSNFYDTDSVSEIEFDYDYDPTFEMILKDLEQGVPVDGDDESSVSIPPPPPSSDSNRKSRGFGVKTKQSKKSEQQNDDVRHNVNVMASDPDTMPNTVEVVAADDWSYMLGMEKFPRRRRTRLGILCLTCMLLMVVFLALAVKAGISENSEVTSNFASANTGDEMILTAPPTTASTSSSIEEDASTPSPTVAAPVGNDTSTPSPTTATNVSPTVTTSPTSAATLAPSTLAPVEDATCNSLITSDESCYLFQSEINIIFDNCAPEPDDWIGIWPIQDATDLSNLPEPVQWLWSCGSQNCAGEVLTDTLPFGGNLPVGTYVAHMVRLESEKAPYSSSYAISSAFGVSLTC